MRGSLTASPLLLISAPFGESIACCCTSEGACGMELCMLYSMLLAMLLGAAKCSACCEL